MIGPFFQNVLPSMLAFAFSGVYTIVDGFFVGRSLGDAGLAAVNIAYPLAALIQAIGSGIGMGGAVHVGVARGRGDAAGERAYLGGTVLLLAAAGVAATALLLPVCSPALELLGARGAVHAQGSAYIRVVLLGAVFQLSATGLAPLLRNYGGGLLAMGAMIAGFATNVALDAALIAPFGVRGAALATVIGQAVTVAPCAIFIARRVRGMGRGTLRLTRAVAGGIARVGLPPFGLTLSPFIVIMLVNRSASVHGGEAAVAAYAVISYAASVVYLLLQGIGDGCQPLISLYIGAGETGKARAARSLAWMFSLAVAAAAAAGLMGLLPALPAFFGAGDDAAPLVRQGFPYFAAGFGCIAFCRVTASYFYAAQRSAGACLLVYGEPVLLCALLAALPAALGLRGVWLSAPVAQGVLLLAGLLLLGNGGRGARQRGAARSPSAGEA